MDLNQRKKFCCIYRNLCLYMRFCSNGNYFYLGNIIGLSQLSPQSSCASSRSESRLDDASNRSLASGMRGICAILTLLRNNRKFSSL